MPELPDNGPRPAALRSHPSAAAFDSKMLELLDTIRWAAAQRLSVQEKIADPHEQRPQHEYESLSE